MIDLINLQPDEVVSFKEIQHKKIVLQVHKVKRWWKFSWLVKKEVLVLDAINTDILEEFKAFCTSGFFENKMEDFEQDLVHVSVGLSEEVGELNGMIKKHVYHSAVLDHAKAKSELGDILWYWMVAVSLFGFSVNEVVRYNYHKLKERYPEGRAVNYQARKKENFEKLDKLSRS